ncbi:MAG: glutamine-hydrolyzing GMP synthase, partial [Clostridiales bacterium]|nr:glutamine-hydrolyzing GMP synthase [Clostridiales bacterium]
MAKELIIVLDFGGQYNQLIARRVRDLGVYAEVYPSSVGLDKIRELDPKGIIFTGGPQSVYKEESQHIDPAVFDMGIPILGICYGAQLMTYTLGGKVEACSTSEYGRTRVKIDPQFKLFEGLDENQLVLMSHTDRIVEMPKGFSLAASSE